MSKEKQNHLRLNVTHPAIPMLNLVEQYNNLKTELDEAIRTVLASGAYINGPDVSKFEENMENFLSVKHAIGVASGSDALLLSLHALSIKPGDKVIVPTFTFFATAGAVSRLGAIPVFVDIDPFTYNLDLDQVEEILKQQEGIKAIIPVHLFGLPVDMQRVMLLAEKYNLVVIEDTCQAINAEVGTMGTELSTMGTELGIMGTELEASDREGRSFKSCPHGAQLNLPAKAGTIGHTGCFSFFPSKNLGCFGDGGMIVTNDDELAETIRILSAHGSKPKYYHCMVGYNSRLDTTQAAILNVKLNYIKNWTEKRRQVASLYNAEFYRQGLTGTVVIPGISNGHVFHQYVIQVDKRDELLIYLKDQGVSTAIYYPLPLHLQQCFSHLGYRQGDLPIAEKACQRVLALPIDPELSQEQVHYIVDSIKQFQA